MERCEEALAARRFVELKGKAPELQGDSVIHFVDGRFDAGNEGGGGSVGAKQEISPWRWR